MKLAPGAPLTASLLFDAGQPCQPACRLALADRIAQLEWDPAIIAARLAVSPLGYPPEPGLHAARSAAFEGLHGFLADSLPEGWGHLLMRRRLARLGVGIETLTVLERLALVGAEGRGALVYEPSTAPRDEVGALDLDALAREAALLFEGEEGALADALARLGGSSGGARPKVHVGFDGQGGASACAYDGEPPPGHEAWIVKFKAPNDPPDIGPIEEAYALMAEAAGLAISAHRLLPARKGPGYFAARRFDRPGGGRRLHMASLCGALEAPPNYPSAGYDTFLRATSAITRHADDLKEAFRRMVFNVLSCNRDDHTRQHSYLMDPRGEWRLAPAYDLTFSHGPGGEHYMDVAGEGRHPTRGHVLALGARHGFGEPAVDGVIEAVRAAVARWPQLAAQAGVSKASTGEIASAHAAVWRRFCA